jgi:hypothetical protein
VRPEDLEGKKFVRWRGEIVVYQLGSSETGKALGRATPHILIVEARSREEAKQLLLARAREELAVEGGDELGIKNVEFLV